MMTRLLYVSRIEIPAPELADACALIQKVSVRNNHRVFVSGALLAAGDWFIQVLEGDDVDVDETFARIGDDPRHSEIVTLERERTAKRTFPLWGMRSIAPSAERSSSFDPRSVPPRALLRLLEELATPSMR